MSGTDPGGISYGSFVGAGVFLVALAWAFVGVRVVGTVKRSRGFHTSDYVSILSAFLLAGTLAIFIISVQALQTYSELSLYHVLQIALATSVIGSLSAWMAKASILFLYIEIFGIKPWMRIIVPIVLVVTFIVTLIGTAYVAASCSPVNRDISLQVLDVCQIRSTRVTIVIGGFGLATDLIILVLPIPIILPLRLALSKKIGLGTVFFSGIFLIEHSVAIVVGCVPPVYVFWSSVVTHSTIYHRVSAIISRIVLAVRYGGGGPFHRSTIGREQDQEYGDSVTGIIYDQQRSPEPDVSLRGFENNNIKDGRVHGG
ncbi:hypothetical protein GGR52DRAFT_250115 [Hypoxylon sp. FL1284]|nr:hypothetical protein GGR52DRAFT_250115 [Hypoxylon sp. FL1284]